MIARKTARVLGGTIAVLALIAVGLATLRQVTRAEGRALFGEFVTRVGTTRPVVALTFDDGPTDGLRAKGPEPVPVGELLSNG